LGDAGGLHPSGVKSRRDHHRRTFLGLAAGRALGATVGASFKACRQLLLETGGDDVQMMALNTTGYERSPNFDAAGSWQPK